MKKTLSVFLAIFLFGVLGITAFAEAQQIGAESFEWTAARAPGAFSQYFIFGGQKRKIKDNFTLKELGFKRIDVKKVSRKFLKSVPDGEDIKISPPKISGIIDMHEHFRVGGDLDLYFGVAKELGIEKTVFVPTGSGPDNKGYKENMPALLEAQKQYPDKIIAFCTVDEADSEAPKIFEDCLDNGGQGLKLMVGHPEFYDVAIDSPIMKELFKVAQKRDVPVLLHVSIMTIPATETELKRLLSEFSDVRVQFAHYCSAIYNGVNLNKCESFLDLYPNLYIDLSMGGGIKRYFGYMKNDADMQKIKDFVLKYQDRIFFGSDFILAPKGPTKNREWLRSRMMCDFSLHQEKEYMCPAINKGEFGILPGFELTEDVLRKLYIENPKKFLRME